MAMATIRRQDGRVEERDSGGEVGSAAPRPDRAAVRATCWFAALWAVAVLVAFLASIVIDRNTDDDTGGVVVGLLVGVALLGSTAVGTLVFAHAVWLLQLREAVDPVELPTRRQVVAVGVVGAGTVAGVWAWLSPWPLPIALAITAAIAVLLPLLVAHWLVGPALGEPARRTDP